MILDVNTKLEAVLAGAVSANQPEVHVDYVDWNNSGAPTNPIPFRVALNSTTDVTILAAPTQNPIREPVRISVYNKDTATVTVTIKTDDGTNERIVYKVTLLTLEALMFEKDTGWYALTASGGFKQGGVSGVGSSTNNGMARWDGTTGTAIKDTTDITYDGTTYIIGASKFTVVSASGNTAIAGTLGVTGTLTGAAAAFSGNVISTGANSSHAASKAVFSFEGGNSSQVTMYGSGTGTSGTLDIFARSSDASINVNAGRFTSGGLAILNTVSIPAGGTAGSGYLVSSATNFGVFFGSGAPSLSAAKGSLYLRSDGSGTGDRAYINTNGSTTWTALTTAA